MLYEVITSDRPGSSKRISTHAGINHSAPCSYEQDGSPFIFPISNPPQFLKFSLRKAICPMVTIYSDKTSPRLRYTLKLVFEEVLGISYRHTRDPENFSESPALKINYSDTPLNRITSYNVCYTKLLRAG